MKTQSLMGFKCRKPKIQSRPLFSISLFMRSPFLISQTMALCRDPEAATRKNVLAPASTNWPRENNQSGFLKLQREKLCRTGKKKDVQKMQATFLVPSKIWRISIREKGDQMKMCEIVNVHWNSALLLVNSLMVMELCVCVCTKDEKQERVPAHAGCGRPPLNKFNFTPACKHFACWLSEEGRLTPLTSQLSSRFCGRRLFSQHFSSCLCSALRRWTLVQPMPGVSSTYAVHPR